MISHLFFILFFLCSSIAYSQTNSDPRMIGLTGAYTTLASGYQSVGVNPANLSVYQDNSMNIFNIAMGFNSNSLSISNYNALSGSNLEDSTSINYYPKSDFINSFNNRGIRFMYHYKIPIPFINLSLKNFAITTNLNNNIDFGLPDGLLRLLFYGNTIGSDINIEMEQFISNTQDFGVSYSYLFDNISFGFSFKYLLGLFYMGMESIGDPGIKTEITGFSGQNKYLIQQAIGGGGLGLDIGMSTTMPNNGYRFGVSIINLLGTIEWSQEHFMRSQLENSIKNSTGDLYLRPSEFMFVNMVMDSVTGISFSDDSTDPLIYYDMYKVIYIENLDDIDFIKTDSVYIHEYLDGYLIPSGGKYKRTAIVGGADVEENNFSDYSEYSTKQGPFITREPIYLRLGLSKHLEGDAVFLADLITGFSNNLGSSTLWKLSLGTEIIRFKNQFYRLGYSFGGLSKKSFGLGYGYQIGKLVFDFGISFNGGFNFDTAKGIDFAFGIKSSSLN